MTYERAIGQFAPHIRGDDDGCGAQHHLVEQRRVVVGLEVQQHGLGPTAPARAWRVAAGVTLPEVRITQNCSHLPTAS